MLDMASPRAFVSPYRMAQTAPQRSSRDEAAALGKAIKNLRESMGLSQEELAGRMGVERHTISRYETGRPVILRTDLQRQVVEALGVSWTERS